MVDQLCTTIYTLVVVADSKYKLHLSALLGSPKKLCEIQQYTNHPFRQTGTSAWAAHMSSQRSHCDEHWEYTLHGKRQMDERKHAHSKKWMSKREDEIRELGIIMCIVSTKGRNAVVHIPPASPVGPTRELWCLADLGSIRSHTSQPGAPLATRRLSSNLTSPPSIQRRCAQSLAPNMSSIFGFVKADRVPICTVRCQP